MIITHFRYLLSSAKKRNVIEFQAPPSTIYHRPFKGAQELSQQQIHNIYFPLLQQVPSNESSPEFHFAEN